MSKAKNRYQELSNRSNGFLAVIRKRKEEGKTYDIIAIGYVACLEEMLGLLISLEEKIGSLVNGKTLLRDLDLQTEKMEIQERISLAYKLKCFDPTDHTLH